jgi:protein-L-isoaspartate(D-aspartate) O-methyltransferase
MNAKKTDIFADDWQDMDTLISRLKNKTEVLKSDRIEQALKAVDRKDFVRDGYEVEAYEDYAIPIGEDQSISQPTTVVYMLETLGVKPGQNILDVGCGSGWTTALLAHLTGTDGQVTGVEINEKLAEFGQANLSKYDYENAKIRQANAMEDTQPEAPFDRILASAAAPKIPDMLTRQLKKGGVLVMPIEEKIIRLEKEPSGTYDRTEKEGFRFVPMQGIE